mgnify:CR=1 FL=1
MAEELTKEQKEAIHNRGGKLLVSAAAGSGKTKVLVDRLLSYIMDPVEPANIDDFLIITYTKAAAAELRGKIASKLQERISATPNNYHLQKQMQRLYLAKISTVHAFCTDILREHVYQLDISADFRVADEDESLQMQLKVIENMLEERYAQADSDPDFCAFIDSQGFGRDDREIPQILLKVYNSAMCHLHPEAWLDRCNSLCDTDGIDDASETVWGSYLIEDLHRYLDMQIAALERCVASASCADNFEKPVEVLSQTISQLAALRSSKSWDDIFRNADIDFGRLVFSKKCTDIDLTEQIKAVRNACKAGITAKLRRFTDDSEQILSDVRGSAAATRGLVSLVKQFTALYDKLKRSYHVLDFADLEHRTLDLLLGKGRSTPTATAHQLEKRFREVLVDEYQDTNAVQDAIFDALTSKRQNCFMVGDVKQSIYQFRLADPSIFLQKYEQYDTYDTAKKGHGRKVFLSKNFRSAGSVIDAVNDVFSATMSPAVGGLYYTENEALREGVPHIPNTEPEIELYGIDIQENTYPEEAAFVATRIKQLLDGRHMVRDKDKLRPIEASDIAILLRSPGSVGGEFVAALNRIGVRCTFGGNGNLLSAEEIETLRAILMTISNPTQDIPLIAMLSSRVFGFTADELASIRSLNMRSSFYSALKSSQDPKAANTLKILDELRMHARICSISGLLSKIFVLTRIDSIYAALDDGESRVENLQAFLQFAAGYEGSANNNLDRFLEHLKAMEEKGIAATGGQTDSGAVTLMSIHKSKGLEFPVVFLCGLARAFNNESARAQVLCDKELGLGLNCIDVKNRVRYPTVAKRAISCKILADSHSEEMRVLYVAMTRAKDRLIMTYAVKNPQDDLSELALQMHHCDMELLTTSAECPGKWVLAASLGNTVSGMKMQIVQAPDLVADYVASDETQSCIDEEFISSLKNTISFEYPYEKATSTPSKQTATELKGRQLDHEAAEDTEIMPSVTPAWRTPSFMDKKYDGRHYGTAMHAAMQYIRFENCTSQLSIDNEILRIRDEGYISDEQANIINRQQIFAFFNTDIGKKLQHSANVLREFKFSILDDAGKYQTDVDGEKILIQGVVDCAMIEDDGIIIIDFKSDHINEYNLDEKVKLYAGQINTYSDALSRIYDLPVKEKKLYFFAINKFIKL